MKENYMKRRLWFLLVPTLMFSAAAFAQRAEIFGDYTFMQFNPTITGVNSRALNGGGGGFQVNVGRVFGIKGEFQGYMSTETTVEVKSPIGTPAGVIPVGTYKSNATQFTYLFGPVIRIPAGRVQPFGELLFGGMNTNMYSQLLSSTIVGGQANANATQHPFAMAFGGGLDVSVNKHVSLRLAEMDWVLTRFTNVFTNSNNQNSFRYLGGIVFNLGYAHSGHPERRWRSVDVLQS
jgi:outer membrane immunogenic protein